MKGNLAKNVVNVSTGSGRHKVHMRSLVIDEEGVVATVTGGEKPHIGAVAIAQPRPSLRDPEKISSTSSVISILGHRDDEVAKPIAKRMAEALNRVAVVAAGVHVENASSQDIDLLVSNSLRCAEKTINQLKR